MGSPRMGTHPLAKKESSASKTRETHLTNTMKNGSMPRSYQSSAIPEANVHNNFTDNRAMRSNVSDKKPVAAPNKLEKKPSVDINESAEAFIKKFRHQLLLQRLESIENYEQMLARGL
ncbi:Protein of unknown function DUF761 [Theobroma cacao]|nr:Protein of unknown function DUF761 [Theobroma cacao]